MKTSMKWLSVLLALCLLVAGITAVAATTAAGTVSAEAEKDGVRLVLKISDEDYAKTGKISLSLALANDGDKELKNVKTSISLPSSLLVKEGELTKNWEAMTYHELATNEIKFSHLNSPDIPDDPNDPNYPGYNDNAGSNGGSDSTSEGAPSWLLPVILIAAFVIVVSVLIFLIISGRIKKAKSLCILLLVGVLLVPLIPAAYAADAASDSENALTVEQEITIEGEKVTVSASATWEYADPKPANSTLTRADLENAIAEIAWTWYAKGSAYQYDSATLNSLTQHLCDPLCGYAGGKSKLTPFPVMENATSQSSIFTVCSGFAYDTYLTALGYPLLGNKFNSLTMTLWRNTSYPDDMAILRWHTKGKDADGNVIKYNNYDTTYKVNYDCWYDTEEVKEFFRNHLTTMRPGDIIVFDNPGHAMMYVGNGVMLDANGKKYSMDTGTDGREDDGVVDFSLFTDKFFNPDNKNFDINSIGWCENSIVVVRPLNVLTIDDGDGDPSNDLLDPNYKLDTGLLKSRFESDKTNPLKTSDYGIDDVTYTRLKYPMMTINRTSSLTPYGTATLGGTITYSVTVTNNTTNWNYTTYKVNGGDADYKGVDYEELWVLEQIPEGAELESALGATIDGNTLRWNCQLDAGESRTFSYTVRVTGNLGDTIVSTGGWVANIPSNTLTNIIGGKKLPNKVSGKMTNLFEDGRDAWNSNDGYKISANVNSGTKFAERIYQITTGLDLQLPDVQEIMDIFFSEYEFYEPYGLYLYHDSSGIHRYMYRLNDKAPNPEDQIYYDMLVPGHFGGLWCYTDEWNGETRISETREEYLEIGDIMICLDLTEAEEDGAVYKKRVVEGYTIIVYLGNGNYASLNSEGRMDPIDTSFGHSSVLSHDLFVTLRPRQAYADITKEVPAFTGTAPDLTEDDKRQTYKPNPSTILLGETGCKQFAELSITDYDWIKVNGVFPGEVYSKLGMDIVTNGTDDASFATLLKYLFLDVEDESNEFREFGHHYFKLEEPKYGAEKWNDMLLYYEGYAIDDSTEAPITSMSDLHPGDIVMVGSRTSRFYVTTVYQGNGDFLLNVQSLALAGIESKIWGELHFNSDAEFMAWLDSNIAPFAETLDRRDRFDPNSIYVRNLRYECYLVLRPSRAFENINEMVKRNIKDGALTEGEKSALAGLDYEDWKNGGKKLFNLAQTSTWAYGKAGINTSVYLGSNSIYAARNLIFKYVGSKLELRKSYESEFNNNYRTMLLPDSYGGTAFTTSYVLTADMLQVGDLFCGAQGASIHGGTGTRYVIGIYQGNGRFLIVENGGPKGNTAYHDSTMLFSQNIGKEWSYYYVLRPDRIATVGSITDELPVYPENPSDPSLRFIDKYKLADWEKEAISKLTFEDWAKDCNSRQMTNILPWVYKAAGIEIAMEKYGYAALTYAGVNDALSTEGSYYSKILVPGSRGSNVKGSGITDPQIGDIFGGRVVVQAKDGSNVNLYYGAIYQGNGKFLTIFDTYDAATGTKGYDKQMLTVADLDAITWNFRYTLRPDLLATDAPPAERPNVPTGPRDITTGKLTDAEKAALASITGSQLKYPSRHLYGTLPEFYRVVGITVDMTGDYKLTHEGTLAKLFVKSGDVLVPNEATDNVTKYFKTMMVNVYGGSRFAENDRVSLTSAVSGNLLQIGDIVAGYYVDSYTDSSGEQNKDTPFTALYQGDGKFLVVYPAWDAEQGKQAVQKVQLTTAQLDAFNFKFYYTLRPENLNDLSETPDTPVEPEVPDEDGIRDISKHKLTTTEKNVLANLKPEDVDTSKSGHLHTTMPSFYLNANIEVLSHDKTASKAFGLLFAKNTETNYYERKAASTDEATKYFQTMLIDCYGGTLFAQDIKLSDTELQIGDIFVGRIQYAAGNRYWSGLYQGDGNFLMVFWDEANKLHKEVINLSALENKETYNFVFYFVLRPEQLATAEAPAVFAVTWKNEDGSVLERDLNTVAGATPEYNGETPVKDGYTFTGWTPEIAPVTGDVTYTATFTENTPSVPTTYTVTWKNADGTVLETDENVAAGTTPEYNGETPVKDGYTFAGWTPEIAPVTGDVTYTATFTENTPSAPTTYTVTWKNADGTVLETDENVAAGTIPTYDGKRPYSANAEGFAGWDQEIVAVTGDITYTATFAPLRDISEKALTDAEKEIIANLTLTDWTKNVGSRTLEKMLPWVYKEAGIDITSADHGYRSRTSAQINNVFTGNTTIAKDYYTKLLVEGSHGTGVTGVGTNDLQIGDIFVAAYTWTSEDATNGILMYYVAVYQGNDTFLVAYDKEAYVNSEGAAKRSGASGIMSFAEIEADHVWTYRYILRPSQLATPAASATYTVTWKNDDGTVLETDENVAAGTIPTYDGAAPTKAATAQCTYTFAGWTPTIEAVSGDVVYTATYTESANTYTVIWKNDDGTVLETDEAVAAGEIPTYDSATPVKDGYTFAGWTPTVEAVSGDAVYTATFTEYASNTYTVTWKNEDGTVLETDENVTSGVIPTYDGATPTKEATAQYTYTFAGWTPAVEAVTGDIVYTATFTETRVLRELTANKLTAEEMAALANITVEDIKASGLTNVNVNYVAPWVYGKAGIDCTDELSDSATRSAYRLRNLLFNILSTGHTVKTSDSTGYSNECGPMLVTNTSGGLQMAVSNVFTASDLQIGDLFCGAFDKAERTQFASSERGSTAYYTALYQGDGNFLLFAGEPAVVTISELLDMTYSFGDYTYSWSYYFVIRPENYGGGMRDIADRKLTEAEKQILSTLDINSTVSSKGSDLNSVLPAVYAAAGISMDDYSDKMLTGNNARKCLFGNKNCYLFTEGNEDYNADNFPFYRAMLVDGLYGGTAFKTPGTTAISAENLEIGDIFVAQVRASVTVTGSGDSSYTFGSAASYATWVYQGNGKFDGSFNYAPTGKSSRTLIWENVTLDQILTMYNSEALGYYYVLRPDQLAD